MGECSGKVERDTMHVLISGGFDPIHVGHVRYIQEARKLGSHLTVIVNSDEWLKRKKGKAFMSQDDRKEIIKAISGVSDVYIYAGPNDDVSDAILRFRPDIFAKGGDRTIDTLPQVEINACKEVGCEIICNVGGDKIRSSSELLKAYAA